VDGPVRPLPQEVVLPRGPAGVPAWGHGPSAGPTVENMGLPPELPTPQLPGLAASPPAVASAVSPTAPPPPPDPCAQLMAAHRHTDTLPLGTRPGKVECKLDVQRFHPSGPLGGASTTQSATRPRPSSLEPPALRSLF